MSKRSELTESTKKEVAGRQFYRCANKPNSKLDKLEDYDCPLWACEEKKGSFDKSGYAIDHIKEFSVTKDNDISNLQALCVSCHTVKTKKFMQKKKKMNKDYDSSHDSDDYDCNCVKCIENDSDFESHGKECPCNRCTDENIFKIKTYEDYIKYSPIDDIIITNKTKKLGYIKFKNQFWRKLYDINAEDYKYEMETFDDFIKNNYYDFLYSVTDPVKELLSYYDFYNKYVKYKHKLKNIKISHEEYLILNDDEKKKYNEIFMCVYEKIRNIEYDYDKIIKNILNKCYKKEKEYKLKYHEYALNSCVNGCVFNKVFNAKKFKVYNFDNIKNKIIVHKSIYAEGKMLPDVNADIKIIDNVFKELVNNNIITQQFKNLCYSIIVKQSDKINIFYDCGNNYLTEWLINILDNICGYTNRKHFRYSDYCLDKNIIRNRNCVIIDEYEDKILNNIISKFKMLNIKNMIIKSSKNNIYNVTKFENFFEKNQKYIQSIIDKNMKKGCGITYSNPSKYIHKVIDGLQQNLLKWICTGLNKKDNLSDSSDDLSN